MLQRVNDEILRTVELNEYGNWYISISISYEIFSQWYSGGEVRSLVLSCKASLVVDSPVSSSNHTATAVIMTNLTILSKYEQKVKLILRSLVAGALGKVSFVGLTLPPSDLTLSRRGPVCCSSSRSTRTSSDWSAATSTWRASSSWSWSAATSGRRWSGRGSSGTECRPGSGQAGWGGQAGAGAGRDSLSSPLPPQQSSANISRGNW